MVNNSTNIIKANNHLSPKLTKHKKDHDTWLWNLSPGPVREYVKQVFPMAIFVYF